MARRQEQEPATKQVREVAPGVLRMELPIHIPGLRHVNCYALLDGDGVALVDPGLPGPWTWRTIGRRLSRAGVSVRHVHTVVVTHSHPDHFGGAVRFSREVGAKVVAHSSFGFAPFGSDVEAPEVSVDDLVAQRDVEAANGGASRSHRDVSGSTPSRPAPWGREGGLTHLRARARLHVARWVGVNRFVPSVSHPVQEGNVLRLARREWYVLHTPGHTGDHVCLHDRETGTLLAGDHVLPSITPHISGMSADPDPLRSFVESLDRVAALPDVRLALPAHGHPFTDLRGRVKEIKRHHEERLESVRRISRTLGPATVEQFSRELFGRRSWGMMAQSETYAHLEHLRLGGEAERYDRGDGQLLYVTR